MKKEEIIRKWINGEDLPAENKEFFGQLDSGLKSMKAPDFDSSAQYIRLKSSLNQSSGSKGRTVIMYPYKVLAVAAAIALVITFYFIFSPTSAKTYETGIAETVELYLPDSSLAILNSSSRLTFNIETWDDNREVKLEGEAYFEVRKGSKFSVNGTDWQVSVLGTMFNVLDRGNVFQVKCYEGRVAVKKKDHSDELTAGNEFRLFGDDYQAVNFVAEDTRPKWIGGELVYESMPVAFVIEELERNYDIDIVPGDLDENLKFTGVFTRADLQTALNTLSLSTGCSYEIIDQNKVVLTCDNP